MVAQLVPDLYYKDFTNGGTPLAFGQVFTYAAGTTNPQATYVDSTQTTQNTNPIILNARGEAQIWLDQTLIYKFVVTDANGNVIRTVDQVQNFYETLSQLLETINQLPAGTAPTGSELIPALQSGYPVQITSAQIAQMLGAPRVNVLAYGADPTGVSDSTSAIQAAMNAVSLIVSPTTSAQTNVQGGEVFFPKGFYKTSSTLYLNSNVHWVGEDCGPIQESGIATSGIPGCAMILYTGPQQSIAVDCSGFWFHNQNAYFGTATAGGASTITIGTGLTVDATAMITITAGTGNGQSRTIASYSGGVATVGWPWDTVPDNTSQWSIPGHAIGSRYTQLISGGENSAETYGYFSYSQGVAIKNVAIVTIAAQYMGLRLNVAPQCVVENVLISGFQVSMEASACAYGFFKNVCSVASQVGFGWISNDHATRIGCLDFGVGAIAAGGGGSMSPGNRPWFVDYMAQENLDPNPGYGTAHYVVPEETGVFISCDGEGWDRSYLVTGTGYEVFIGCHMERWNQIGAFISNVTAIWQGGDWYSTVATQPAFSGVACNFTLDSCLPDPAMSGNVITIGSFPNTYGGRVTVRNCPPQAGDTRPALGSLVQWDAFPPLLTPVTVSTVGAATLSAAQLYSSAIIRSGAQSGNFSDTTDTAANLIAYTSAVTWTGLGPSVTIYNTTSHQQTLLAGSSVTFVGNLASSATIASGASRTITIIPTSSTTVEILG
jgi:hypothetical protein